MTVIRRVARDRATSPAFAHFAFVLGSALLIGWLDAAFITKGLFGAARWFQYKPLRLWVVVPLCWAATALPLAAVTWLLFRRWGAFVSASAFGIFFVAMRLGESSRRVVVAGAIATMVACVVVAFIARWWMSASRPRLSRVVFVLIVLLALGAWLDGRPRRERVARDTASASAPNVLVIVLDTVRYDAVFTSGSVDPGLPALASLARESVVFDRAYATAPWTLPSHFSAMTGLPAEQLGVDYDHQHYDRSTPTLAERFRRRGYRTVAVLANTFVNRGTAFQRGFDVFDQNGNGLDLCRSVPGAFGDRNWPWFAANVCHWGGGTVTRTALAQLDHSGEDRPLFLLVNYMDAHDPYYVEPSCRPPGMHAGAEVGDVARDSYRETHYTHYQAAIRCLDRHLGPLLDRARHSRRPTVIAVMADHGEQFGEHGLVRHGDSLYSVLLHVPLMIRAPGLAPRRVSNPMSLASLPQLIDDTVAGRAWSPPPGPVVSYLVPPAGLHTPVLWSAIDESSHLVAGGNRELLFDLARDPAETRNILGTRVGVTDDPLSRAIREAKRFASSVKAGDFRSVGYIR